MRTRTIVFCIIAVLAAALFIRLGFWQLGRLHERQDHNRVVMAAQRGEARPIDALPGDSTARYLPARVTGRWDYAHELILSNRTNQGSPGVDLVTPLRLAGRDTAVLVNRGWVYSPNGGTVDRQRWYERDTASVTGYIELYAPDAGTTASATDARIVRRVSRSEIASKIPYPVAPWYLIQTSDTMPRVRPVRRLIPELDEGAHRGYAIQWFFFATTALVGALAVVLRERNPR